jgi:hypothetical protein
MKLNVVSLLQTAPVMVNVAGLDGLVTAAPLHLMNDPPAVLMSSCLLLEPRFVPKRTIEPLQSRDNEKPHQRTGMLLLNQQPSQLYLRVKGDLAVGARADVHGATKDLG